jgi:hypothetical protein
MAAVPALIALVATATSRNTTSITTTTATLLVPLAVSRQSYAKTLNPPPSLLPS